MNLHGELNSAVHDLYRQQLLSFLVLLLLLPFFLQSFRLFRLLLPVLQEALFLQQEQQVLLEQHLRQVLQRLYRKNNCRL